MVLGAPSVPFVAVRPPSVMMRPMTSSPKVTEPVALLTVSLPPILS